MSKLAKPKLRALLLASAIAITLFVSTVAPNAKAVPDGCKIMEVQNQQGQTCWICVSTGEGAECVCGGMLCFL